MSESLETKSSKQPDGTTVPRQKLCYTLKPGDIFRLVLRIHGFLLLLPIAFLIGIILFLSSGKYATGEIIFSCFLFAAAVFGITYIYLSQYYVFKKQYFFIGSNIKYQAEFSGLGLTIFQGTGKNLTEYFWEDFIKCLEKKDVIYLFFRYDRAIIIKKQQFLEGNITELRELIEKNIAKFIKYRK